MMIWWWWWCPDWVVVSEPDTSHGWLQYNLLTLANRNPGAVASFGQQLHVIGIQVVSHCSPSNSLELVSRVLRAIDSIHEWMSSNRLSLNTGKPQFIWLGTKHSLAKRDTDRLSSLLPSLTELTSVRNLGFIIDQELNMKDHITKLCQSFYYRLRQIRTVRHSLTSSSAIQTLVHAFVCTRVDFSNSLLCGTSTYLLDRLQSVLNSSARLILKIGKYDPISAAIRRDLHWLPIQYRIQFKLNSIRATAWLVGHQSIWLNCATP